MSPLRIVQLGLAVVAVAVSCGTDAAAQSPLSQVPAGSPVVIHIRGQERTIGRMKKTLEAALGDLAPMATGQIESGISSLLAGREPKALAADGPLFLVFTEFPQDADNVEMALVAKVANFVQFRDSILTDSEKKNLKAGKEGTEYTTLNDKTVHFLSKGEFAIVAFSEKAIKPFTASPFLALDGKLDQMIEKKFLDNDISVYIDAKQLNKQFAEEIAGFKQLFEMVLQQAEMLGGLAKQMDAVKKIYAALFQIAEDSEQVVGGVSFEPEGVRLQGQTKIGDKSQSRKFFAEAKSLRVDKLAVLPSGQMSYSSSSGGMALLQATGISWSALALPAPNDEKANKDAAAAIAELHKLRVESWLTAADYPFPGIQVIRYEDNVKAAAAMLKLYQTITKDSSVGGIPLKDRPETKANAQKIGAFSFHFTRLGWDIGKFLETFPEEVRDVMKQSLQKSLGDDQRIWFGTDGKQFLQVNAKDWDSAEKLITAYLEGKESLAQDKAFAALRKQLPEEGNMLMLFHAGKFALAMVQSALGALRGLPGAPAPAQEPKLPDGPSNYFGLVVGGRGTHGAMDLWLPAAGIKDVINVFKPIIPDFGNE